MSTITIQTQGTALARRRARLLVAPLAALAVAIIWLLADKLVGVDLQGPAFGSASPHAISLGFAATVAALAALLGWGLLALFERFSDSGAQLWLRAALLALLVSFAAPLSGHGVGVGDRVTLVLMHIVAAAVVIPYLYRTSGRRPGRSLHRGAER